MVSCFSRLTSFANLGRHRLEADDLVAAQRLQKWLKAATDKAAQNRAVNFHLADSRCAPDLQHRRGADEADLHALYRQFLSHAPDARAPQGEGNPSNDALTAQSYGSR